jgi:hypothetical protein
VTYERPGSVSRLGLATEAAMRPSKKTTISVPIKFWVAPISLEPLFFPLTQLMCHALLLSRNLLIPSYGHATPDFHSFLIQPIDPQELSFQIGFSVPEASSAFRCYSLPLWRLF